MFKVVIIIPIVKLEQIIPTMGQDKNIGGIRICVDLRNLNVSCVHDSLLTPFIDEALENMGEHEVYSFTNGFSGYHQVKVVEQD